MPTDLPKRKPNVNNGAASLNVGEYGSTAGNMIVPAVLIALATTLPLPLLLPVFGIAAFVCGLAAGLWNRFASSSADDPTAHRDAAGLLVLIGSGAIMIADLPGAFAALSSLEQSFVN